MKIKTTSRVKAFFLGMYEFRSSFTTHFSWGREWAHRLTFRRFEQ